MPEQTILVYEPRTYREFTVTDRFFTFRVAVETSDLYVKALVPLQRETENLIRECRAQIKLAISRRPIFLTSFSPLEEDPRDPPVVQSMIRAGKKAGTGPMAAVAGAVADYVGRGLLPFSPELIIENGGDIFLSVAQPLVVGVYAGDSPLTGRLGIRLPPTAIPLGVCTSSGRVGPSCSLGKAHAATVLSRDIPLADAMATALGNRIHSEKDLIHAVSWALGVPGVIGAMAIIGDKLAAVGDIELVPLEGKALSQS